MNVVVRRFMRGNAGLTLLELFVVFLIMSIVMGMLLSAVVSTMASNRLAASTSGVAGAIRTARSLAITSGAIYNVRFVSGNEPYVGVYYVLETTTPLNSPFAPNWYDDDDDVDSRRATIFEIAGARARLEYTTSFQSVPALPLYFYPDGSASLAGSTVIRIQDGSSTMREVEVFGVTGEITERRAP